MRRRRCPRKRVTPCAPPCSHTVALRGARSSSLCMAGSSPRWTDFCRFCCIAPGTRMSARRSVLQVIYYHYDEYLARMRRDIAPVHDIATFCTLQEPQITTDDPETTRDHALQTCCTRHLRRHAQPLHCMRLDRTLCRRPSLSSDKRTTTEAEQELLTSWTCRRSARS